MPRRGFTDEYYLGGEIPGGGQPELFSTYYQTQGARNPFGPKGNPMLDAAAQQSSQRDLNDRQYLQDLYGRLQNQAAGGMTPQQAQQIQGFRNASQMQQQVAASQPGGARARSAAMGGITQQAGIQGADNGQQQRMLQAQDQLQAQSQMQQVAAMQRQQDLQSQGLTAEDAYRQAQLELRGRGLNIQRSLGYAGLEGDALKQNMQAYLDAYRRSLTRGKQAQQNADQWAGRAAQGAAMIGAAGV